MNKSKSFKITGNEVLKCNCVYLCAKLYEYSEDDWQIEYYAQNPQTGKMKRFRIRVNKIVKRAKNKREVRTQIAKMCEQINLKLYDGWNPFFEGEDSRLYTKISDVVDIYLKEKSKELRPDTMRCYTSFSNILLQWVSRSNPNLFCFLFDKSKAILFMDYVYNERNVSSRTYNDYLKLSRCFFE